MVERATPEILWHMHSCFARDRTEGRAVDDFADDVSCQCDDRFWIAVHEFGSRDVLDPDLLRTVSSGDLDMATFYSEYLIRDAPDLALCCVQGVLERAEEHRRALPVISALYHETFDRWDIETIGLLARPAYDVCVFAPEPVDSLSALAGRTIRVWSRHQVAAFARLGVSAVIVPQNAMVEAFRLGAVDCALYPAEAAGSTDLATVAPYHGSLHPFSAIPVAIGASRKSLKRLQKDLQAIIAAAGNTMTEEALARARAAGRPPRAREEGGKAEFQRIAPFPEADRRRFRTAAQAAWADLAREAGPEAVAARARVLAALDR